jgi:four helix bundle protein
MEFGMSDEGYSYRNLILWQKAQDLTLEIIMLVRKVPNDRAAPVLARQIVRSTSSIAANIAEGHGRYTLGAHRNHLSIAKGSACETDSWLDLLRRTGYLQPEAEARLHAACQELIRMLTAKIVDLERKEKSTGKRIREESEPYLAEALEPLDEPQAGF